VIIPLLYNRVKSPRSINRGLRHFGESCIVFLVVRSFSIASVADIVPNYGIIPAFHAFIPGDVSELADEHDLGYDVENINALL
jgi:hypothetical protein